NRQGQDGPQDLVGTHGTSLGGMREEACARSGAGHHRLWRLEGLTALRTYSLVVQVFGDRLARRAGEANHGQAPQFRRGTDGRPLEWPGRRGATGLGDPPDGEDCPAPVGGSQQENWKNSNLAGTDD